MSADLASSKVVIQEEPPTLRAIPSASTSVAGAVGVAQRGPIGQASRCTSFEEFQQRFGGFTLGGDLALAAMGFFENGGTQLWAVRTAHYVDPSDATTLAARRATGVLRAAAAAIPGVPADTDWLRAEGKDLGAYANRIQVEVRKSKSRAADAFDLAVIEDGRYREVFADVRVSRDVDRNVVRVVNAARGGSLLIQLTDLSATGTLVPVPATITLTGGDDGLTELNDQDFIGTAGARNGLHAFDRVQELATLFVPGRATPTVHRDLLTYCERDRDGSAFAVLDPPVAASAEDMVTYIEQTAALLGTSEFGAIYWPRVTVPNPARSVFGEVDSIVAPPSGAIAGVFARTDAARPGGVYDPPAGIDKGRLIGINGFETDEVLEERKRDLVYPKRINPLTTSPGLPRYIDGSRTLKADGNFPFVAERRGVSFMETSLRTGLQFARHRNNNEALRAEVRRVIASFLTTQMQNGAFRSQVPDSAFFVDVLEDANLVFEGKLVARVGLATNKPAEFIIIRISQDTRALSAEAR